MLRKAKGALEKARRMLMSLRRTLRKAKGMLMSLRMSRRRTPRKAKEILMTLRRTLMTVFASLAVVERLYTAIIFCTMFTSGQ